MASAVQDVRVGQLGGVNALELLRRRLGARDAAVHQVQIVFERLRDAELHRGS